jgi:hypothetical protein
MGKGSRARPFEVDTEEFASAWERTFGKKENKTEEEKTVDSKEPEKDRSENDK